LSNDPHSPSYQSRAYQSQAANWRFLEDVYHGVSAWTDTKPDGRMVPNDRSRSYLPQEPGETDDDYAYRLASSHFDDKFAQAVRDYVGLIFSNGLRLVDVPQPITDGWGNLDGHGGNGNRVLSRLALRSLRRGHTFALVDYPAADPTIRTLLDSRARGRSPFWVEISPLQVLNWRFARVGNQQVLQQVSIQVEHVDPDGLYGEQFETRYLVLQPGRWELYRLAVSPRESKKALPQLLDQGVVGRQRRGRLQPLDHIPLRCIYGGDRLGHFASNPTLLTLAKLNVAHYQVSSDHRQKMHRCCFPQAVRVGGQGEDLVLGPKVIVDVPIGGSFGWAEPRSDSLDKSRQEVADMDQKMDFLGADYLVKPGDRQAAKTTEVQATKVESELYLFASDFAQGVTDCLKSHAAYLGLPDGGRVEVNTKFFESMASDPNLLQAFVLMRQNNDLSRDELRRLARDRNFFPKNFLDEDAEDATIQDR